MENGFLGFPRGGKPLVYPSYILLTALGTSLFIVPRGIWELDVELIAGGAGGNGITTAGASGGATSFGAFLSATGGLANPTLALSGANGVGTSYLRQTTGTIPGGGSGVEGAAALLYGGGGGSEAGSGYGNGGSGGWSRKNISVTPGQVISYTIGAGGTPGTPGGVTAGAQGAILVRYIK
jgi:hypothetical protein